METKEEEKREPFSNDNEEIPKLDKEKERKNSKICIIALLVIFILSVIISIILNFTVKSEENNKITAKYISNDENEKIILFNSNYLPSISSIKINGTNSELSNYHYFKKNIIYEIVIELNETLQTLDEMFLNCENLIEVNLSSLNINKPKSIVRTFSGCKSLTSINLPKIDMSKTKNISGLFKGCSSLISINLEKLDTSKVEDISEMFSGCSSLTSIDFSKMKTSNVLKMNNLFESTSLKSIKINFDTSKVIDMSNLFHLFHKCTSLSEISFSEIKT